MTTTQTVEDILRPLVEATIVCPGMDLYPHWHGERICLCGSPHMNMPLRIPNPSFDVLRLPCHHENSMVTATSVGVFEVCLHCNTSWEVNQRPPDRVRIDASLGAVVQATQECDLVVQIWPDNTVRLYPVGEYPPGDPTPCWYGEGATPEEATARALVAAWRDGLPPSSTEPHHESRSE